MRLHDKVTVEISNWEALFLIAATMPWLNQQEARRERYRKKAVDLLTREQDALAKTAERKMAEVDAQMARLKRITSHLLKTCSVTQDK